MVDALSDVPGVLLPHLRHRDGCVKGTGHGRTAWKSWKLVIRPEIVARAAAFVVPWGESADKMASAAARACCE
jgi:hypothetical protein